MLCPGKINEFLSVGELDGRGYHPIRTIYSSINLCDILTISACEAHRVEFINAEIPEINTVTKALNYLENECGIKLPKIYIKIVKNIPIEAGLGGGSSNAGAVLRFGFQFAQKTNNEITEKILNKWVENSWIIGADVPFFVKCGRATGESYGEVLKPLPDIANVPLIVVKPKANCSTKEAYNQLDSKPRIFKEFPLNKEFLSQPYNDFERTAPCECIEIAEDLRKQGAYAAMLSGSGSAVFGAFESMSIRDTAFKHFVNSPFLQVFSCETMPAFSNKGIDLTKMRF